MTGAERWELSRPLVLGAPPVQLLVHARGSPRDLTPAIRAAAFAVDPALEIHDPITLVVVVSMIALVLSLAGIYAAMSFAVSRRTREIGIRVALGACRNAIVLSIFRRPLIQLTAGVVVGALLTIGLMNTSDSSMTMRQWSATIAYIALIAAITALACVVPTRRALRIEPTEALRTE